MEDWTILDSDAERRNYTGSFCGFVLLKDTTYDLKALEQRLVEHWAIQRLPQMEEPVLDGLGLKAENKEDMLFYDLPDVMITISYASFPIPEREAERFAERHSVNPEEIKVAQAHRAHLMVAVLPGNMPAIDAGKLYVKVLSACLDTPEAIGVYAAGIVRTPDFYRTEAEKLTQGIFPQQALVHIGVVSTEQGNNAYTIGLDAFGKDEFEILGSTQCEEVLRYLLTNAVRIVLEQDLVLRTGDTLQVPEMTESFLVTRRDGTLVEGHSIQITY